METQKTRIARGIALLDEKKPGWCNTIDLARLDIDDGHQCVLGQVFGTYSAGVDLFWGEEWVEQVSRHAFLRIGTEYCETDVGLTRSWRKAIREHCK